MDTAAARSCYASQRMVEGAAEVYRAEKGALPQTMDALVAGSSLRAPQCPNGGQYTLEIVDERPVCRCAVHGYYADAEVR